jgi:hypothetical protein
MKQVRKGTKRREEGSKQERGTRQIKTGKLQTSKARRKKPIEGRRKKNCN